MGFNSAFLEGFRLWEWRKHRGDYTQNTDHRMFSQLKEVPKPVPTDDELLIRVQAASINGSDREKLDR
jgi:hypothetical protein